MSVQIGQSNVGDQLRCLRGENYSSFLSTAYGGGDILSDSVGDAAFADSIVLVNLLPDPDADYISPAVEMKSNLIAYTSGRSAIHISGNFRCFKRYEIEEVMPNDMSESFNMFIKWGNLYYHGGGTWGAQSNHVTIYGKDGGFSFDGKSVGSFNYGVEDGLIIPFPTDIAGMSSTDVYIGLCIPNYGGSIRDACDGIVIRSFNVKIVEKYTPDDKIGEPPSSKVIKKTGFNYPEDYSIELSIASPNQRNNGIAILRNKVISNNSFIEKLHTGGIYDGYEGDCWAEQRLADKISDFSADVMLS